MSTENRPIWIDVRDIKEYKKHHLEGAINIPCKEIKDRIKDLTANFDQELWVYCKSGLRSKSACRTLRKMGFTNVVNKGTLKELLSQKEII